MASCRPSSGDAVINELPGMNAHRDSNAGDAKGMRRSSILHSDALGASLLATSGRDWIRDGPARVRVLIHTPLHKGAGQLCDLLSRFVKREMPRVYQMDLGIRHIARVGVGCGHLERWVVAPPHNERGRVCLRSHACHSG